MTANTDFTASAQETLRLEAEAISAQLPHLGEAFNTACRLITETKGHLIITGLGKSGHIGSKLAATFASTGTPAFFVHPAEAGHGDLGMITADDTLLALSFSGESSEIMTMIPIVKNLGVPIISITGRPQSAMAQASDIHLQLFIEREACPLGLAPTTSAIATLALGDAMAIAIMSARNFTPDDFARSHPFGRLGRRLITKVSDVMRTGNELPISADSDSVQAALFQITEKRLGLTLICDGEKLEGIYTDGDLRRTLSRHENALQLPLSAVMTKQPAAIAPDIRAAEALHIMEEKHITALPVVENGALKGVVHIHDLLQAGVQ